MGKEQELFLACQNGDMAAVEALLGKGKSRLGLGRRGVSVNISDPSGFTPLHKACLMGHFEICQLLLNTEAHAGVRDSKGLTPLHLAAWGGHMRVAQLLLTGTSATSRASVNVKTMNEETSLHMAAQHGHPETVEMLLKYGADPTITNRAKETPLDLAAQYGRANVVRMLLQHKPDLYLLKTDQQTALHRAARNGHVEIVELLVESGMDINTTTDSGTALHEAALYGKTAIVKYLLDHSVSVTMRNTLGQTAADLLERIPKTKAQDIRALLSGHVKLTESPDVLKVCAKEDYTPGVYDQGGLAFKKGEIIVVLDPNSSGWWKGRLGTKTGVFPNTYVEVIHETKAETDAQTAAATSEADVFNPFLASDPDNSTDSLPASDGLFGEADPNTSDEWSNAAASLFFAAEEEQDEVHEDTLFSRELDIQQAFAADAAKVRAWLSDIKLSQFSDAFVDNGFDSLGHLYLMESADFVVTGVVTPRIQKHIAASLMTQAQDEFVLPDSFESWLDNMGLSYYLPDFQDAELPSMAALCQLDESDLVQIGVQLKGHRQRILKSLQYIRNTIPELMPSSAPESPSHQPTDEHTVVEDRPDVDATPEPASAPPASTGTASHFDDDFGAAFEDVPEPVAPPQPQARPQSSSQSPRARIASASKSQGTPQRQPIAGTDSPDQDSEPPSPSSSNVHVTPGRYCYKVKYLGSRVAGAVCSGDAACQALSKMRSSGKLLLDKAPIALVITAKTVEYIEVETNITIVVHETDSIFQPCIDRANHMMFVYLTLQARPNKPNRYLCHAFMATTPAIAKAAVDIMTKAALSELEDIPADDPPAGDDSPNESLDDLEAQAAELEATLADSSDINFDDYTPEEMAALEAEFAEMEADMT